MPISQAMIAAEVTPEQRGLAMGVTQNFGSNLLGSFVAPVLLVGVRDGLRLARAPSSSPAFPGLVAALLIWWLIREPAAPAGTPSRQRKRSAMTLARRCFAERNVLICAVMGVLLVSYLVVCWAFMPLYLTQVRGFDAQTMGWLMGTLGISATIGAFAGLRPVRPDRPAAADDRDAADRRDPAARRAVFRRLDLGPGGHLLRRLGSDRHLPAVHGDGAVGERRPAGTSPPCSACAWEPARSSAACCRRRSPASPPTPGA